jgi:hypothetical protein
MYPPILITSSVNVADRESVKLINPEKRIFHTLEAIAKWCNISPGVKIVLCDNSNFNFTRLVKSNFPNAQIECISFEIKAEFVKKYSKGYGEGEIIKYSLNNAVTLRNVDEFVKITGKLWVENFYECSAAWNSKFLCYPKFKNVFSLSKIELDEIDTRFYITSKTFYEKYLMSAHYQISEGSSAGIEVIFKNTILQNGIEGIAFPTPPVIGGVGGGSGRYYNISTIKKAKEYTRYALIRRDKRWGTLFSNQG